MRKTVWLTLPAADENGLLLGSHFEGVALAAGVLTPKQICQKYNISREKLNQLKERVHQTRVLDVLFHYPDGPMYDILLYLVASCR